MTANKHKAERIDLKALAGNDREFLRQLIRTTLQEVLEAEMTEALAAAKSGANARWAQRLSFGLLRAQLDHTRGQAGTTHTTRSHGTVFNRAVRALSTFGTRVSRGAGRDVRARGFDAQGQGNHRGVMRPQLFSVGHQHDQ